MATIVIGAKLKILNHAHYFLSLVEDIYGNIADIKRWNG